MKKLVLSYKTIKWLCILLLAALLVPLLCLGFYAAPAADDFSYGAPAHRAWVETGSALKVIAAAADKTADSYFSWQGTFSAIFLMAIQPAVFSENLYWLTTVIMLLALVGGFFCFCRGFFVQLLGLDKHMADIIAALLSVVSTQLLPSAVQAFFWFNGAVYYVLFNGLLLMALALGIGLMKKGGLWRMVLLCLMALVIGGGNYVTCLEAFVIWFFATAFAYIIKAEWKRLVAPGLVLVIAFVVNMAAPGNAMRAESTFGCGPVEAIILSFKNAIVYSGEWMSLPVLAVLVFIGLLALPAVKNSSFAFRFPGLVSAFSYCLFSAMFCPPAYAMSNAGEGRLQNILYFSWLLLLAINLVWWLGWLCRKQTAPQPAGLKLMPLVLACLVMAGGWLGPALAGKSYTSLLALGSLRSGEAKTWHDSALRRFAVLNDESVKEARIEPYPGQPYLLFYSDIVDDPEAWENVDMASFYGKDYVTFNTLPLE